MPIVKFEQDPTQPQGTGNFTDDQGRTIYTTDLEAAKRLSPSLSDQVNRESTAAATAAVGAPPKGPDQRLASNMTDAFEGVGGTTTTDATGATGAVTAATPASPAATLVAKTGQVGAAVPGASGAPQVAKGTGAGAALVGKLDQLPIAQRTTSSTVQQGRDAGKVEAEVGALHEADQGVDAALRQNAENADARTEKVAEGEQAIALSEHTRNYVAAQQERQRAEQIDAEIRRLSGEQDPDAKPTRLLDNMSTGKSLAMVLLAGIAGAFGNMHGEGRNTFIDAVNQRLAEDLQVQRDQIASGRLRRNNLIAHLQAQGADARQAQLAYESRVYGAAADWARAQIKSQGLQGAQLEQANLQIAQLDQQRAARDAALREQTESKYATTTNTVRVPLSSTNTDPMAAIQKTITEMRKNGYSDEQISDYVRGKGVPSPTGGPQSESGKYNVSQSRIMASYEDAREKLKDYAKLRGFYFDDKSGEFVGKGSTYNILPDAVSSQNANINALVDSVAPVIGLVQGVGLKAHDDEIETIQHGLKASSNTAALAALNQHWKAINNVVRGVERYPGGAGAGVDATEVE